MKKTLMLMTVAALAAGVACAQDDASEMNPPPAGACDMSGPHGGGKMAMRGNEQMGKRGERPAGPMDAETMQSMRAIHEEIRDLAGAARVETDEAKKAELVSRLRAKLGEVADLIQAKQEQRLAQAEERLGGLKERIEYAKAHREEMLDEQVQRVLAGERPGRPGAFNQFPNAKGGMRGGPRHGQGFGPGGEMPPPSIGGDELAPPPEDLPEDMPPPPEE